MTSAIARPTVLLLGIFLLVACSATPGTSPGPSASVPPSTSPTASPTNVPTSSPAPSPPPIGDSNTAVVRIEQTGGMLPPWVTLSNYPSVVLYGDGRLIMQGPQIEIYPGPALPNLQLTHLTQAGVAQVRAWAEEAGLHGPDRQLGPMLLDAGFTLFTVVSEDGTHRTSVTDLSASDPEIGAVRQFQEVMLNLRAWLADDIVGDDVPYVFDRLQIVSNVADPASMPDPQLSTTVDWPLDQPLATLGVPISDPGGYRCSVIEGENLETLMPLFAQSNELTLWQSEDDKYQLELRPLLPDEDGCPGFSL